MKEEPWNVDLVVQGLLKEFECRFLEIFLIRSGVWAHLWYPWKHLGTSLFNGGLKTLAKIIKQVTHFKIFKAM